MHSSRKKVLCFCLMCKGDWVSTYVHKKHMQTYSYSACKSREASVDLEAPEECPVDGLPKDLELVGNDEPINLISTEDNGCSSSELQNPLVNCNAPQELMSANLREISYDTPLNDNQLGSSEDETSLDSNSDLVDFTNCDSTDERSNNTENLMPDLEDQGDIYSGAAVLPLYEGSSNSVLHTLVKYFHWFSEYPGISKESFSSMLAMQSTLLPPGNNLPTSYEAARRAIEPHLVQPIIYDVCKNDCLVFRGLNAALTVCPECGCSRYTSEQSCIAVRRFTYLPLKPRLVRMFGNANMAQVLQAHAVVHDIEDNRVVDIQQSLAWKNAYHKDGIFEGDPRGISLALCTDGVNPFAHNRVSYSMWPIMLTLLNLPMNLRNRFASIMLVGIIPSNGSQEPKSLNPYLDILVDELLELSNCTLFDAYQKAPFNCKVALLLHILDYPGMCKVMSVVGSGGLNGCMFCNIKGVRDENLNKTVYLQNRRFLSKESSMRKDKRRFPGGDEELKSPPHKKIYQELIPYHEAYDNAKKKTQAQANLIAKHTGCKGTYPLMRLPYHNRIEQTVPDAMHTVKDCVEKIFYLITGKSDAKGKICKAEAALGRFGLDFTATYASTEQLSVPWLLSKEDVTLAAERLNHIRIPAHIDCNPHNLFSNPCRLKSHDWKQVVTQGILKYCLRDMLGRKQQESLIYFFDVIKSVLGESHDVDKITELKEKLNIALALMERDFPLSIQDITTHLMHHIVDGIRQYGPVYNTWMYSFERFNSWLTRRALNRFRPEATIMETYRIFEWCEFISLSVSHDTNDVAFISDTVTSTVGSSKLLQDDEVLLFKPLCESLNLPLDIQSPTSVSLLTKVMVREKLTGRVIEYTPSDHDLKRLKDNSIVLLNRSREPTDLTFGRIESLFSYRNITFVIVQKFECMGRILNSLVCISDTSVCRKQILALETISRPLVTAMNERSELWILNI